MPSIAECLGALVRVGQIDKATAKQAQDLYDRIMGGESTGGAQEANAALRAAQALKEAAEGRKYKAVLDAKAQSSAIERIKADPRGVNVGAVQLFQRLETSAKSGGINVDSREYDLFGQIGKPFAEAMERYASKFAGLTKDLTGPRNMVRELFGVRTGDDFAREAADGWTGSWDLRLSRPLHQTPRLPCLPRITLALNHLAFWQVS